MHDQYNFANQIFIACNVWSMKDHVIVFGFYKKTRSEKEFCRNLLELLEGTEKFYKRLLKCNLIHSSNGIQFKYDEYGTLWCTHWYLVLWRQNFKIMLLEVFYSCDDLKVPYSALFA